MVTNHAALVTNLVAETALATNLEADNAALSTNLVANNAALADALPDEEPAEDL